MTRIAQSLTLILLSIVILVGCEKEFDPNDAGKSYNIAKEYYDDENYPIAVNKLGEFKSRFPYSKYAVEAELLVANCFFEMGDYDEASIAYEAFVKLHPTHEKVDFAMFRIGMSYWKEAPEETNREQEFTIEAIDQWKKLVESNPDSKYVEEAKKLMATGKRRLAESYEVVGNFYCKQEIYHACVSKFMDLLEKYSEYNDISYNALVKAAGALTKLAEEKKKDPSLDTNLFFKTMTYEQMLEKAEGFLSSAKKLKNG